jgi:hypothetical protein
VCQWNAAFNAECTSGGKSNWEVAAGWKYYEIGETDNSGKDWGCQFVISDTFEADGFHRKAATKLDQIEMKNCG